MIERLEKLFNDMGNNDTVSLDGLNIGDVSKLLALLKADKVFMNTLDAHMQICFDKAEDEAKAKKSY